MKVHLLLTAAVLSSAAIARADVEVNMAELRRIGFLPQDKADLRPENKIDIKRRNPFAERKKIVASRPAEQVETEESKLRTFFDKLQVSGLMELGDKRVVTLGRLTLEAGQIVPSVIANQTQILRVIRVEDNLLEIGWVEEAGYDTSVPRKIIKKIDLTPKIIQVLASEDNTGENANTVTLDATGKVLMPPREGLLPNPSALVDNLPPSSDINPLSTLTADEQAQMKAAVAAIDTPPGPAPAPEVVPDALPGAPPAPAPQPENGEAPPPPPKNPEDSVQPDPDLAPPPAESRTAPAGPPAQ
jgi:hypothetical protein